MSDLQPLFQCLKRERQLLLKILPSSERGRLMKLAMINCTDQTVRKWLGENSESSTFTELVDIYLFLKKRIDEEEKKDHDNTVDITFAAHGSIREPMMPACCLMPLSSIKDVVLYAPWNSATSGVAYGIATGRIRPEHRVFYCKSKDSCKVPDEKHRPMKLPDHWNSMKNARRQMIPNITLSPLKPEDGIWKYVETRINKYGPVGRNRIIIPFILPDGESPSVPFCVITLALSLVLLQSRFKATVHLDTCLRDISTRSKSDREYLEKQYAYAADDTLMKCSEAAYMKPLENLFPTLARC
ncbi:uncharacterized protein LOC133460003 [Cololabis saira]|uniref:uncharacterized protein LOC133460003 n=1 Tax=Cololabis saira TaxID=129043 RepID=UPI002AD3E8A2|nr:uncharacterized protein LOC133460003 [Cololabis saira]